MLIILETDSIIKQSNWQKPQNIFVQFIVDYVNFYVNLYIFFKLEIDF